MTRAWALAALLMAMFAVQASAHGPTRQKAVQTIEINVAPAKVWAVIGNFQDMSWHPAIEKTEGSGDTRKLTLKGGGTIDEKLGKHSNEQMSYSYEITNVDVKVLPVQNYSSTLSVKGEGDKSVVEWRGAFYRGFLNNDPPPELNEEAANKAVMGVYKSGLEALKSKLEAGG